jgi:hypothetical protein
MDEVKIEVSLIPSIKKGLKIITQLLTDSSPNYDINQVYLQQLCRMTGGVNAGNIFVYTRKH